MTDTRGRFPPDLLDTICGRVSLVDLVSRHVALKRQGREYVGLSPFKTERTPSFTVAPEKGFYHCFSSGEHGDAFDFVMKTEGLSFPEAVEKLAGLAGIDLPGRPRRRTEPSKPRPSSPAPAADLPPDLARAVDNRARDRDRENAKRLRRARKLWKTAGDDPGCTAAYLADRGLWPPHRPLPAAVRWLPQSLAEPFHLAGWPEDAAGCIVYGFAVGQALSAVQLECLTADGSRRCWLADKPGKEGPKRKAIGIVRGAAFRIPGHDDAIHVCEGPIDALAVAAHTGATVWASAGAGVLFRLARALAATGRPVTIDAQANKAGRAGATKLWLALLEAGAHARIEDNCPEDKDPADCCFGDLEERAAILQEAGMNAAEAWTQAWREAAPGPGGPTGAAGE